MSSEWSDVKCGGNMFWGTLRERVDRDIYVTPGCWWWVAMRDSHGYGKMCYRGVEMRAHHGAYRAYVGDIPPLTNGQRTCVLHRCDNPSCVNPDHLFLGTQGDNMRDKAMKGRCGETGFRPGEMHRSARLTADQVRRIRSENRPDIEWSKLFSVSKRTIYSVRRGHTWKSV